VRYTLFADESGTHSSGKCYSIGVISVPTISMTEFQQQIEGMIRQHGVMGEVKWKKISKSHGLINFAVDLLRLILKSSCQFSAIVVKKDDYRKWQVMEEKAFYTTYSLLLRHKITSDDCSEAVVYIDNRQDSYSKQHEVLQIVTNHMLAKRNSTGQVIELDKADSKRYLGIQAVDMLVGAINASHNLYLDPHLQISPGKLLALSKMAALLGWDKLCYDTFPNGKFNIWHFPSSFRGIPMTRKPVINLNVPYVSREDVLLAFS